MKEKVEMIIGKFLDRNEEYMIGVCIINAVNDSELVRMHISNKRSVNQLNKLSHNKINKL